MRVSRPILSEKLAVEISSQHLSSKIKPRRWGGRFSLFYVHGEREIGIDDILVKGKHHPGDGRVQNVGNPEKNDLDVIVNPEKREPKKSRDEEGEYEAGKMGPIKRRSVILLLNPESGPGRAGRLPEIRQEEYGVDKVAHYENGPGDENTGDKNGGRSGERVNRGHPSPNQEDHLGVENDLCGHVDGIKAI